MPRRIIPKVGNYNKVDVLSFVKMKIKDDSIWAKRACSLIYNQQDKIEKKLHLSREKNGCGFGRYDTPKLSKIACKINRHQETLDDINTLKKLMPKYAAQIICCCDQKKLLKHLDAYYKPQSQMKLPF